MTNARNAIPSVAKNLDCYTDLCNQALADVAADEFVQQPFVSFIVPTCRAEDSRPFAIAQGDAGGEGVKSPLEA